LKNRIHASLLVFGHPYPVSDLLRLEGRGLLLRLELPEPWLGDVEVALRLIDQISFEIGEIEDELKAEGVNHPYVPLLRTVPDVGHVLGYTIAAEIGDIGRFENPSKLCGYTGLCPRVYSPAKPTTGAASPRTDRSTCAGRSSRRPPTPLATRSTPSATPPRPSASGGAEARRSPGSTSPAASPRRSRGC
jgi:hypothetical protein